MLGDKSVLITGGTGSLGQALVKEILHRWPEIKRLVVFSRDELKQYDMRHKFPENEFPALRFFLGDVRDLQRLRRAFNRVDVVIHAAALKQVPAAEYNPVEFIRTNVMGAENVVEAAIEACRLEDRAFLVAQDDLGVLGFATYFQFRGGVGYAKTMEHTILTASRTAGSGLDVL